MADINNGQVVSTSDKIVLLSNIRAYHNYMKDNVIDPMSEKITALETKMVILENKLESLTAETTTYSVIARLDNAELSNNTTSVKEGSPYTVDVSPFIGHHIDSVTVVMDGEDITEESYSDGTITIPSVTGDVYVTVSAVADSYSVSYDMTNAISDNTSTVASYGSYYSSVINPLEGYGAPSVTVTMGGVDITASCVRGNVVSIPKVTGDISVTAVSEILSFTISYITLNTTSTNTSGNAVYGSSYSTVLNPNDGYKLGNVRITMGGEDITDACLDGNIVTINKVTGNISINVSSVELSKYSVTNRLTGLINSSDVSEVEEDGTYSCEITPDTDHTMGEVTVLMGGEDITEECYSNGTVTIQSVSGDITITGEGVRKQYTITNTLTNVSGSNEASKIYSGDDFETTLTADDGYRIDSVTVKVGSSTVKDAYDKATGKIVLTEVRGNVSITASAVVIQYNVTLDLTNTESSNLTNTAPYGSAYVTTISCLEQYRIGNVTVSMGGSVLTDAYNGESGTVSIPFVTGDISISAVAIERVYYTIDNFLVGMHNENNAETIEEGSRYTAELSVLEGYENPSVTITMGGVEQPGAYADGTVTLDSVSGNIVINGVAEEKVEIPVLESGTTENGADIVPDVYNINNNPNQTTKAPFFIVIPKNDIEIETWSIAFGSQRTTSSLDNKGIHSICPPKVSMWDKDFENETVLVGPSTSMMYGSSNSNMSDKTWFDGTLGQSEAEDGGIHSVYGEPITVNGQLLYKYTSKKADGSKLSLKAGVPYTFGIYTGVYLGEQDNETNFAVFDRPEEFEGDERWLALGNNDYRLSTNTYAGTSPLSDFVSGGKIPAIWFDGEIYTDFGTISEGELEPVPTPGDIEDAKDVQGSQLILSRSVDYAVKSDSNDTTVAPFYIVRPAHDITVNTWTVAVARPYLTSTSNDNRSICPPKVSMWDDGMNTETILSSNLTAMVYGHIKDSNEYAWFDGTLGHTSAQSGGIMSLYGEPITINEVEMYKYKCKLANGEPLELKAGVTYTFGIYAGMFNDTAGLQTRFPVFETQEEHEWCALGNNNWRTQSNTEIVGISPIAETITDGHLPVIWFNDELFTDFTDDSASSEIGDYTEAETYQTPGLSRTDFNYAWEIKNNADADDRVILVMRHSERGTDTSSTGGLTNRGEEFANLVGQALAESDTSSDMYGSTAYSRTMDTAYRIAVNRGYEGFSSYEDVTTNSTDTRLNVLDGKYYTNSTSWPAVGRLCQENRAMVETKFHALVRTLCETSSNSKFALYVTHDFVVVPSLCYLMDRVITETNWVNYMSGIGIIVHPNGSYEVYPLKSFDNGLGGGYDTSGYDVVHDGMDNEINRLAGGGQTEPADPENPVDGVMTTWSEDFSDYDVSQVTNSVNSWYSFTNDGGKLKIDLSEPDGDNITGWYRIPVKGGNTLDLSDGAYMSVDLTGTGDPVLSFRFVDSNGNYSQWIDIGRTGLSNGKDNGSINTGTVLSNVNISSYMDNGSFDRSDIIALEGNMIQWSFSTPSYKKRSKTMTIDNLVVSNSSIS